MEAAVTGFGRIDTAIVALLEAKDPPLRLPLGMNAIARIEDKHAFVEGELGE